MFYRVILAIEHLEDGSEADNVDLPIKDEQIHTMRVLAIEQSFAVAQRTFDRIREQEGLEA
jgi:hypothetical protein